MDRIAEFFSMGGYAAFVWAAYGISAIVLACVLAASLRGLRRTEAELARLRSTVGEQTSDDGAAPALSPAAGDGR